MTALPLDPDLQCFVLQNGLTVYVRPCAKPANVAEMRLVVRVGSLMEEEHERGIAHFLEHMAFKGTKSFDKGELIAFTESLGMKYGQHTNASTAQEETTYNVSVPLGDDSTVSCDRFLAALTLLREFSTDMRISDDDVETERQVIEEERRLKAGAHKRLLKKWWEEVFREGGAVRYGTRMPIGLSSVVRGCSAKDIRSFYEKWYTPDRMAIIIVGDFDGRKPPSSSAFSSMTDWIVDVITSTFGSIPAATPSPAGAPMRKSRIGKADYALPVHRDGARLVTHRDTEFSTTTVSLEFFERLTVAPTFEQLREEVLKRLVTTLVDQRLTSIGRNGYPSPQCIPPSSWSPSLSASSSSSSSSLAAPFLWAGVSIRPLAKHLLCTGLTAAVPTTTTAASISSENCDATALMEQQVAAVGRGAEALIAEAFRMARFGFTAPEFDLAKRKWLAAAQSEQADLANVTSERIVQDCWQHFTRDGLSPLAGPAIEVDACLRLLEDATLTEVNDLVKRLFDVSTIRLNQRWKGNQISSCTKETLPEVSGVNNGGHQGDGKDDDYHFNHRFCVFCVQGPLPSPASPATPSIVPIVDQSSTISSSPAMLIKAQPTIMDGSEASEASEEERFERAAADAIESSLRRVETFSAKMVPWPVQEVKTTLSTRFSSLQSATPNILEHTAVAASRNEIGTRNDVDAVEYTLSNGIVVCLKKTTWRKGQISFQGFQLGGSSELIEADETAFSFIDEVADKSGLGDLDGEGLAHFSARRGIRVNTQRHMMHRGLGGSGPSSGFEELLQMLALKLTPGEQPFSQHALARAQRLQTEGLEIRRAAPEFHLMEKARLLGFGDQPVMRPQRRELMEAVTVEDLHRLYHAAFLRRPQQFRFVFIGDLPARAAEEEESDESCRETTDNEDGSSGKREDPKAFEAFVLPLLEKYLGSLRNCDEAPIFEPQNKVVRAATNLVATPGAFASAACDCQTCDDSGNVMNITQKMIKNVKGGASMPWADDAPRRLRRLPLVFTPGRDIVNDDRAPSAEEMLDDGCTVNKNDAADSGNDGAEHQKGEDQRRASTLIVFRADLREEEAGAPRLLQAHPQLRVEIKVACQWLEAKLLSVLRTDKSLLYNVSVAPSCQPLGDHVLVNVTYTCDPCHSKVVEDLILDVIREAVPTSAELEAAKAIVCENHGQSGALRNNSYWMFWLLDTYKCWDAQEGEQSVTATPIQTSEGAGRASNRASWVGSTVISHSTGLVSRHLNHIDVAAIERLVRAHLKPERCIALTLMPVFSPATAAASSSGTHPPSCTTDGLTVAEPLTLHSALSSTKVPGGAPVEVASS